MKVNDFWGMAKKGAQYLRRHFERNPKYFQHYKSFMDEIINKGYTEQSDDIIHHKMEGSSICHIIEFTTNSNLKKSVLPLIAALSIEEGQLTKSYWLVQI